jgi:tripartite-type tricarboxylate transporter receptor subunit TctC
MPDVQAKLKEARAEVVASTPEQMAAIVRESRQRWAPVVKAANIRVE